jgi:hypothetical protein
MIGWIGLAECREYWGVVMNYRGAGGGTQVVGSRAVLSSIELVNWLESSLDSVKSVPPIYPSLKELPAVRDTRSFSGTPNVQEYVLFGRQALQFEAM